MKSSKLSWMMPRKKWLLTNVTTASVGLMEISRLKRRNLITNRKSWKTFSIPSSRGSTKKLKEVLEVACLVVQKCLEDLVVCLKEVHLELLVEPKLDQLLKKLINFVHLITFIQLINLSL